MKQIVKYVFAAFAGSLLFTGCFDDKGNYDYKILNEVYVDTVNVKMSYSLDQYDWLDIIPNVKFTQGVSDENRLSYKWVIYTDKWSKDESTAELLSTERNLHVQIRQPANIDDYAVVLYITDTKTNTVSQVKYTLTIQPSVVSGILAIHTTNGETDLDYIATPKAVPTLDNTKWMKNIYSTVNGRKLSGNPISVSAVRQNNSVINHVYMATDQEFVQLSGKDFTQVCDVSELFHTPPAVLKPHRLLREGQISHVTMMVNDDKVHNINNQASQKWSNIFSDALAPVSSLGEVSIAPFIYMPDSYMTGNMAVFYDKKGKRFVRREFNYWEEAPLKPFVDQTSTIFDVNNIGKDLIWFGIGYNGHGFALMTDYTLYRANFNMDSEIQQGDGTYIPNENISNLAVRIYDLSNMSDIQNAKYFDCGRYATLFMYATDRDIYVCSIKSSTVTVSKINQDFPADEEITGIMIYNPNTYVMSALEPSRGNLLYVSTWNGTEGKIYEFAITRNTCEMNNQTLVDGVVNKKAPLNVFDGLGKVIDMCIKLQGTGTDS